MPHDLPHWRSCYGYFRQWKDGELFVSATEEMRTKLRVLLGRAAEPSVAILDSQSVRTTEKGGFAGLTETNESKAESGI
jgi:transposase